MNDTQLTIGKILTGDVPRDAIHIAVLPVVAGEDGLRPGDPIVLKQGLSDDVVVRAKDEYGLMTSMGVVDPFLGCADPDERPIWSLKKGQRFWMFMRPNTITGLRHQWQHPRVDNRPVWARGQSKDESEVWLLDFAERWGFQYEDMIAIATSPPEKGQWGPGEYIIAHGRDLHSPEDLGDDLSLFWQHLSRVTGRAYDRAHQDKVGWSCTC